MTSLIMTNIAIGRQFWIICLFLRIGVESLKKVLLFIGLFERGDYKNKHTIKKW